MAHLIGAGVGGVPCAHEVRKEGIGALKSKKTP
jgi:hypothetical protein